MTRSLLVVLPLAVALVGPAPAQAQTEGGGSPSPFLGSVPQGEARREPLALSLREALSRALQFNLGLLLQEEAVQASHGARWRALADLLPQVSGSLSERRQVINLEAFGFPAPDPIVGPFNVFDARIGLSQPIFDLSALSSARAATHAERAAASGLKSAREFVVLVSVNLYLEAVTAASRIEVVKAQQDTAAALERQARNLKEAGLVAGIDVLRAQVQVQNQRQRRILADNAFEKAKLRLARAIGVPPGQSLTLTDTVPFAPLAEVPLDKALADAYAQRPDYLAATDRLAGAEAKLRAASFDYLPTLRVDADYGTIGQTAGGAHPTYAIAATVRVPIFEGGRTRGKRMEAAAAVNERRAELEDLRGRIDMEVRDALLDLAAASQQLEAVTTTTSLAGQQLAQARDRFAAGVAGNLEVTQAQEAVAAASDQYIDSLYRHNLAKASLARAVGTAEQAVTAFLGGTK
ncbi:MAG: TolC family protein [Acidobacteria bacterium]|nr:TolC family protein [Acidobacteriota bacterium]